MTPNPPPQLSIDRTDANPRLTQLAGGLLGLALLLWIHRYVGINHDAILYLGQGLVQRWQEIFGQDLFFAHGSQDRYSIFPWLIGQALQWASPPRLFLWGALLGLLGFTATSAYALWRLLPVGPRFWAWLGILTLPSVYGTVRLFSYGEKFLTPRPFSEALCLLAVAMLARQRLFAALACLAVAGILHPLQALAAAMIFWPWLVLHQRHWLHAVWLVLPVLLLAQLGVPPFSGLFQPIDSTWLFNLYDATPQLFLSKWALVDISNLLLDACLLLYGARTLEPRFSRWCLAGLIGLVMGVLASAILVDLLHLVLPAALQLWRVHWLAHWFAIATFACLLYHDVHVRDLPRILLLTLAVTFAWGDGNWVWCLFALLYLGWPHLLPALRPTLRTACASVLAALVMWLLLDHVISQWQGFVNADFQLDSFPLDRLLLAFPAIGFGLPLLLVLAWRTLGNHSRRLLVIIGLLPIVLVGACRWDSRGATNRIFEGHVFQPNVFGTPIPTHAQVFWYPGSIMGPWLVLQRANYFSPGQTAGEIFSRNTAIDARERIEKLRPLIEQGLGCDQARLAGTYHRECAISPRNIRIACEPGVVPPPDFLVLPYQQPQAAIGIWNLVDPAGLQPDSKLFLYRCSDFTAPLAAK